MTTGLMTYWGRTKPQPRVKRPPLPKTYPRYRIKLYFGNDEEMLYNLHTSKGARRQKNGSLDYDAFAALARLIEPRHRAARIEWHDTKSGELLHHVYFLLE